MSYEVDIFAVGEESKSGDAIALRYGTFNGQLPTQRVVLIDGGFKETGNNIVEHIKSYYLTDTIDLVICSHPDNDHVSGLEVVLQELAVKELWMHRPWNAEKSISAYVLEHQMTTRSFTEQMRKSLDAAYELEKLAKSKNILVREPFQGLVTADSAIHVLGPSPQYYASLLEAFGQATATPHLTAILESLKTAAQKALNWISETWDSEVLSDPADDAVSPRNNSSTVILARLDGHNFVFTADAGVPAIMQAAEYSASLGIGFSSSIHYLQIPHHGSKRNLGPTLLNNIIGPVVPEGQVNGKRAFVSAAKKGEPKHPSKRVLNALIRRGVAVAPPTQGNGICYHSSDVSIRPGWSPLTPISFASSYQEETD